MEATTEISLEVLNERENSLIALAATAKELIIAGVDDKEGYKRVREKRIELKNERVSIQNDAYDLRENAVKFQKTVIKREKQLVAIIEVEEKRLSTLEDDYDQQIEEIRKQKEREENARIQARVDALAKFNHGIDHYDAKVMPEENFQALLGEAEAEWLREQQRIADEKAEQERMRQEEEARRQAEREELARQRAENERVAKEQAEREAILQADRERIQRDQEEREAAIKAEQERVAKVDREREAEFQRKMAAKEAELQAERKRLDDEKRRMEEERRIEEARKESAERARIEEQERIKREAEEQAEGERLAAIEAARKEARRPDKEKLQSLATAFRSFTLPDLISEEANDIKGDVAEKLCDIADYIHLQIEDL